MKTENSLKN